MNYIDHALRDTKIVQLRWMGAPGENVVGNFDNAIDFNRALCGLPAAGNTYVTINRLDMAVTNRIAGRNFARQEHVTHIVRIPVDFDPKRPVGVMATTAEMQASLEQRDRFVSAMRSAGWPMPAVAMSGSGGHALWRCLIPSTPELAQMLATLYTGWGAQWDTETVEFDTTVRNPARILRLYETTNRKGPSTPERPHRMSSVTLPHVWQALQIQQIEAMANAFARSRPQVRRQAADFSNVRGNLRLLDAPAWFEAHGLYKFAMHGGKHSVTCPWASEHSTPDHRRSSDTVLLPPKGGSWWTFFCAHGHCSGRGIRDVAALFGDADRFCIGGVHA